MRGSRRLRPRLFSLDHHSSAQPFCLPAQKSPGGPAEGPSPTGPSLAGGPRPASARPAGRAPPYPPGSPAVSLPALFRPRSPAWGCPGVPCYGPGCSLQVFPDPAGMSPALQSKSTHPLRPPLCLRSCSLLRETCVRVPRGQGVTARGPRYLFVLHQSPLEICGVTNGAFSDPIVGLSWAVPGTRTLQGSRLEEGSPVGLYESVTLSSGFWSK